MAGMMVILMMVMMIMVAMMMLMMLMRWLWRLGRWQRLLMARGRQMKGAGMNVSDN